MRSRRRRKHGRTLPRPRGRVRAMARRAITRTTTTRTTTRMRRTSRTSRTSRITSSWRQAAGRNDPVESFGRKCSSRDDGGGWRRWRRCNGGDSGGGGRGGAEGGGTCSGGDSGGCRGGALASACRRWRTWSAPPTPCFMTVVLIWFPFHRDGSCRGSEGPASSYGQPLPQLGL